MDQTKFINSYINNLAEQVKTMSLDNIMLKTQLSMANEQLAELQKQMGVTPTTEATETQAEVETSAKGDDW